MDLVFLILLAVTSLILAAVILMLVKKSSTSVNDKQFTKKESNNKSQILVDTSAIIDGRIADIAATGFVPGKLLVPRFILAELQNIADSEDAMRRGRGRRGLEMLNIIRQNPAVELDVIEHDPKEIAEVDHKLVHLAREYGTDILTTDYNLNRVATIEKVKVLNINELANAIKTVVIPGEQMRVKVVQKGKEKNQGLAYLEDGTMIVVENGDKLINREVDVEVTRIFQTVAGKMIFTVQVDKNNSRSNKSVNSSRMTKNHRPSRSRNVSNNLKSTKG